MTTERGDGLWLAAGIAVFAVFVLLFWSSAKRVMGAELGPEFLTSHPMNSVAAAGLKQHAVRPMYLAIQGQAGPLVTISLEDGSIEYGGGYRPDTAARAFWVAVGHAVRCEKRSGR